MLVRELGIPTRIWISALSWLTVTVELSYNLCQSPGKMFVIWWKSIDAFEPWCWRLLRGPWTARRLNQSILKEINPEYSLEALMLKLQYFGHLIQRADSRKDLDAGKDWGQEKGVTEDEMVVWSHRLYGHEFEQAPGDGEGEGSLVCCSPWSHKESDMTKWMNNKST